MDDYYRNLLAREFLKFFKSRILNDAQMERQKSVSRINSASDASVGIQQTTIEDLSAFKRVHTIVSEERRTSYSYHRPPDPSEESDEDEYVEVDGVTYVIPAKSKSRRLGSGKYRPHDYNSPIASQ